MARRPSSAIQSKSSTCPALTLTAVVVDLLVGEEAGLDPLGELDLLLGVQQGDLADLLQVVLDRVGRGTGRHHLLLGLVGVVGLGQGEALVLDQLLLQLGLLEPARRSTRRRRPARASCPTVQLLARRSSTTSSPSTSTSRSAASSSSEISSSSSSSDFFEDFLAVGLLGRRLLRRLLGREARIGLVVRLVGTAVSSPSWPRSSSPAADRARAWPRALQPWPPQRTPGSPVTSRQRRRWGTTGVELRRCWIRTGFPRTRVGRHSVGRKGVSLRTSRAYRIVSRAGSAHRMSRAAPERILARPPKNAESPRRSRSPSA